MEDGWNASRQRADESTKAWAKGDRDSGDARFACESAASSDAAGAVGWSGCARGEDAHD